MKKQYSIFFSAFLAFVVGFGFYDSLVYKDVKGYVIDEVEERAGAEEGDDNMGPEWLKSKSGSGPDDASDPLPSPAFKDVDPALAFALIFGGQGLVRLYRERLDLSAELPLLFIRPGLFLLYCTFQGYLS